MGLLKNAAAGLLIAAFPVTASTAAVQSSSVPLASAAAVTAAQDEGADSSAFPWLPLAIIALVIGVGGFLLLDDDDSDEPFSA